MADQDFSRPPADQPPSVGTVFEQFQYFQQTNIEFLPRFDDPSKLIMWPHININTLVKQ